MGPHRGGAPVFVDTDVLVNERDRAEAREDVGSLRAWAPLALDHEVVESAWNVEDRLGLSWWDALIVAAAMRAGCSWLLTKDLHDEQEFFGVKVISPFTHAPGEVLGSA